MKNKILKRILCAALALVLLIGVLTALAPGLLRRPSPRKYFEFYEYAQDYDVLFLGSSHMLNAVIPIQLWDQHGVTSYNLALSGSRPAMDYWTLRNALEFSSPRLVVLDCAALTDDKVSTSTDYNHAAVDDLRSLSIKIRAVFDLFDSWGDRFQYLFPQRDGDARDLEPDGKLGFSWLRTIKPVELPDYTAVSTPEAIHNTSAAYLRRIIEECQAQGVDVLLTSLPFNADEAALKDAAALQAIAQDYDLRCLTAADLAPLLDPALDFANSGHVNLSGAQKLTDAIGAYLTDHYRLPDRRSESHFSHWNDLSDAFHSDYRAMLDRQDTLEEYLMALRHEGYAVLIATGAPQLLKAPFLRSALENLGADTRQITHLTDCILLSSAGNAYLEDFWASPTSRNTALGRLSLGSDADGRCILTLNKKTLLEKDDFGADDASVTFLVLDSETLKLRNTRTFSAADFVSGDAAQLLAEREQTFPAFADEFSACTEHEKLYVLPDGKLYAYIAAPGALPSIGIVSASGGYWYANEGEPLGVFNESGDCSAKRTGLIPVTPGDQLTYRGNARFTPDSVVWLNQREHFIADEKHLAKDEAVIVTAPEEAAYVWFASFDYAPEDEIILEVDWITCQAAASAFVWTDTGVRLYPEE